MRSSGAAQVVIAVSLVVLALGPFVAGPVADGLSENPTRASETGPLRTAFADLGPDGGSTGQPAERRVERDVQISADLQPGTGYPVSVERRYRDVYVREGARQIAGEVPLSEVRSLSNEPGVGAVEIRDLDPVEDGMVAPGVSRIDADELHEQGVTGEGVTVGVIDTGFQLQHRSIAGHVSAYRSFDGAEESAHGTAVASVVADTAPDAELHLAAVGPTTSATEYRQAVRWLEASGVDVIVDAGSYFGALGDSNQSIESVADDVAEDVVFVTSAGNYADRHWIGTVENDSRRLEFGEGSYRNPLNDGQPLAGQVTVTLEWNGSTDYDLYLLREVPTGDVLVASSTDGSAAEGGGHERISTTVPNGRYYVTARRNGNATAPSRVELYASHTLGHGRATQSLTAPATAENVLAVGAYGEEGVESFSSRGPTVDGDRGVDFVAPDAVRVQHVDVGGGTSFAAPYVAGTAALLASADPSLSPDELEDRLVTGASDVAAPGPDPATGHGMVNAGASYALVDLSPEHEPTIPDYNGSTADTNASEDTANGTHSSSHESDKSRTVDGDGDGSPTALDVGRLDYRRGPVDRRFGR